MVAYYANKIENGEMLWTSVPKLWFKKTQSQIIADGYTLNEDGTVTLNYEHID